MRKAASGPPFFWVRGARRRSIPAASTVAAAITAAIAVPRTMRVIAAGIAAVRPTIRLAAPTLSKNAPRDETRENHQNQPLQGRDRHRRAHACRPPFEPQQKMLRPKGERTV
ncbi:hypothetical protein GCM10008174_33640 [Methylopila turkensis]|uniref:Uncharacterized protein n=1 Tax=Methylopila turkensis TaxID=1437816 RepID=A0A9W6JUC8_9HYPH|nr:hypothetical protein GCM10008174_33640 [Methylopila turkensis]